MLPLLLLVVAAEIADGGMDAKAVALLGVLSGACAVLRPITGGVTGVQLMFFLLVPAGRVFGPGFGFVLGNVAMFASAALTGGGGPVAAVPDARRRLGRDVRRLPAPPARTGRTGLLAAYGFVAGVAYGFVLNLWFWPFGTTGTGAGAAVTFVPGGVGARQPAALDRIQHLDQPRLRHPARPRDGDRPAAGRTSRAPRATARRTAAAFDAVPEFHALG